MLNTCTTTYKRFPGQYFDAETNLHYNWMRYFDPQLGRFITTDPSGFAFSWNLYAYANQNSISLYDPNGRAAKGGGWGPVKIDPNTGKPIPKPVVIDPNTGKPIDVGAKDPTKGTTSTAEAPKPKPKGGRIPGRGGCFAGYRICVAWCVSSCKGGIPVKSACVIGCMGLYAICVIGGSD